MARLQASGFTVYHAINGLAGVEAAEMHHPDTIVLDIRMPDIDGYDVCTRIRGKPGLADTPIIFLSANVQDSARRRAMEVGGCAFVSKPYDAADVIAAIRLAVAHSTPRKEEAEHV